MFNFFESHPEQVALPNQQQAMLAHMPAIIRKSPDFSARLQTHLPEKVKFAILASKLASGLVYAGDDFRLYEDIINAQLSRLVS